MQPQDTQTFSLLERVTESLVQPIPNLEKGRESGLEGRARAGTQRHCPLTTTQVLPAPQVLALQHRRVQPVFAGGRRELPLQQAPQGTSPGAWNRGAGLGSGPGQTYDTSSLSSSWTPLSAEMASWRRGKSATAAQYR